MKVPLITPPPGARDPFAFNPHIGTIHVTAALPFVQSSSGLYVHRVRSGMIHLWKGAYSHTTFQAWCGQIIGVGARRKSRGGSLLAEPPERGVFCATCEGRATGAGQLPTHRIAGRFVKFAPRDNFLERSSP